MTQESHVSRLVLVASCCVHRSLCGVVNQHSQSVFVVAAMLVAVEQSFAWPVLPVDFQGMVLHFLRWVTVPSMTDSGTFFASSASN